MMKLKLETRDGETVEWVDENSTQKTNYHIQETYDSKYNIWDGHHQENLLETCDTLEEVNIWIHNNLPEEFNLELKIK